MNIKPTTIIAPMLCQELEVSIGKVMDGPKTTATYRRLITEELKKLKARGYVAEWKWDGTRLLAIKCEDGAIVLQNRNGIIYTATWQRRQPVVSPILSQTVFRQCHVA